MSEAVAARVEGLVEVARTAPIISRCGTVAEVVGLTIAADR